MLGLVEKGGWSNGFSVFFDNLFTSFPMLDENRTGGIRGLVTIRHNCLENAAVTSSQTMKKTEKRFL